ncbi:Aste57867_15946 [Aphanomyces stellatus]|uniref:Aste57867_15946 protein n=1 Tax=Aphanomyces stellatus TaxID=120398 RepID=A0A485L5M3_9STRA|nr:hypothetical protein As57867_015890 [Aphanomyces stellatus]VFT92732.1 Aste57867_15946 [Aphanomyces stellatus]
MLRAMLSEFSILVGGIMKSIEELSPVGKPGVHQRCGPWSEAEVAFATRLSDDFKAGLLPDVPNGIPLRKWLSEKLNCTPMRLSKKFDKTSGVLGMCRYTCNVVSIASMSADKSKRRQEQLETLEAAFRQSVFEEQQKLSDFHIQQTQKQAKKRKKSPSGAATVIPIKRATKTTTSPQADVYNPADVSVGFLLLELHKGVPPSSASSSPSLKSEVTSAASPFPATTDHDFAS